ncbi:MAG: hypothetical protein GF364_15290 [Candidatus Lokiarchaeota archaeon]|nr:hypothetical protein [Candidatus Lokiarchaeota archaeon]
MFLISGMFALFLFGSQIAGRYIFVGIKGKLKRKKTAYFQIFISIGLMGYVGAVFYKSAQILRTDDSFYGKLPDVTPWILFTSLIILLCYIIFALSKLRFIEICLLFAVILEIILIIIDNNLYGSALLTFLYALGSGGFIPLLFYLFSLENKDTRRTLLFLVFGFIVTKIDMVFFHYYLFSKALNLKNMIFISSFLLIGLIFLFFGLNRLNRLAALDWKDEMLALSIFCRKGTHKSLFFQTFLPFKFKSNNQEFLNTGLVGINDMLMEISEVENPANDIKWENLNLLLDYRKNFICCLFVRHFNKMHRKIVNIIADEFEKQYSSILEHADLSNTDLKSKFSSFRSNLNIIISE